MSDPPAPSSGTSRIVSLIEGNPLASINPTDPLSLIVRLNEPVQNWTLDQKGNYLYYFGVGGYPFSGIADGKVIASTDFAKNVTWHVTYSKDQDAYTIEVANDPSKGWTVPADLSANPEIEIKPIVVIKSDPPQYLPSQLFRFQGSFDE